MSRVPSSAARARAGVRSREWAHAHQAAEFAPRRIDEPVGRAGAYVRLIEPVAVSEDDLVRIGPYLADENAPARREAQSAPLPERVAVHSAVGTDALAVVDERPLAGRVPAGLYPGGEVPVLYKADLHAVWLLRLHEAEIRRHLAHLALCVPAQREHEPARLRARHEAEHVALVVFRPAAEDGARPRRGVMSRGDALYAEGVRGLAEQL